MKKILYVILFIVIGKGIYYTLYANPIQAYQVISELAFTPKGWILELELPDSVNTNGWYLVSKQDTAHLKPMMIAGNTQYLITRDSLLEPLRIDQSSDILSLYSSERIRMGALGYDTNMAPRVGQSICWDKMLGWYLDNTPTLGNKNDTTNSTGRVIGWVKDNIGNPLQGVEILGGREPKTDSAGFYSFFSVARCTTFFFFKNGYYQEIITKQILPESTITVNMTLMKRGESVERIESQTIPKNFSISEPFPNPFNPETQILYTLSRTGDVRIDIFDINGKCIDKIFSGYQSAGSYRTQWNAIRFPSGIYIVRIQAGEVVLSKKCALVK